MSRGKKPKKYIRALLRDYEAHHHLLIIPYLGLISWRKRGIGGGVPLDFYDEHCIFISPFFLPVTMAFSSFQEVFGDIMWMNIFTKRSVMDGMFFSSKSTQTGRSTIKMVGSQSLVKQRILRSSLKRVYEDFSCWRYPPEPEN